MILVHKDKDYWFCLPHATSRICHGNLDIYELPWNGVAVIPRAPAKSYPEGEQAVDCSLSLDSNRGDKESSGRRPLGKVGAQTPRPPAYLSESVCLLP